MNSLSFFSSLWHEWHARFGAYGSVAAVGLVAAFAMSLLVDQKELLRRHIVQESSQISWVVFLKGHADKGYLEEVIRSLPGIRDIRFTSKEEALESVQQDEVLSQSLTLTGRNPFPESFAVRWDPFFLREDVLRHATQKMETQDGVDHIGYDKPRVERLSLLQQVLYRLELALLSILWVTGFLIVVLAGRVLFFLRTPLRFGRVLVSVSFGVFGGLLGVFLSQRFVSPCSLKNLWAGAAAGLLLALLEEAFHES
ncbi:MAG: hypothetical protein HY548_10345 [Elusimicrobia bacterium]|nr:hypothetical protein [Elusimicrobiota bacterium]